MESTSPQSSSSLNNTSGHESPTKRPESPVLPLPQAEPIQNSPPKPVSSDTMADAQTTQSKPQGSRPQLRTPEPNQFKELTNGQKEAAERSPSTPGHLAPFDWDEFEARYEEALADADRNEQELLKEFEELVKVSSISSGWLSTHLTHTITVLQCLGLRCLGP